MGKIMGEKIRHRRYKMACCKFAGANGDREIFIFPVQLTTSRIGNLAQLIHTLLCGMILHTCIFAGKKVDPPGCSGWNISTLFDVIYGVK